ACPGAKVACGEACASWQTCDETKGQCVAKACTNHGECAPGGHCDGSLCVAGTPGLPFWVWLAGGGALALIAVGLLLMRKKPAPVEEQPEPEAEAPPPPSDEPKKEEPVKDPF